MPHQEREGSRGYGHESRPFPGAVWVQATSAYAILVNLLFIINPDVLFKQNAWKS